MAKNPYVYGNTVGKTSLFVGRREILEQVINVLEQDENNAIVLLGRARIGKSSILERLEQQLSQGESYAPVFFDCSPYQDNISKENLLQKINSKISLRYKDIRNKDIRNIEEFLATFPDKRLVLLLDELNAIIPSSSQQKQETFFHYLDSSFSTFNRQRLNFVFAVRYQNIEKVDFLLRKCRTIDVSSLKQEETKELVLLSDSEKNDTLKWSSNAIEKIWEQTYGHPCLTQFFCYEIWEKQKKLSFPQVEPNDVEAIIPSTLEAVESAISWIWRDLEFVEQIILSLIAEKTTLSISQLEEIITDSPKLKQALLAEQIPGTLSNLKKNNFIDEKNREYYFKIKLLGRWIQEKKLPEQVLHIYSGDSEADKFFNAGISYFEANSLSRALEGFKDAVERVPNHRGATVKLIEITFIEDIEKSINYVRKFYESESDDFLRRYVLSLLNLETDDKNKQLRFWEKVLEIDPNCQIASQNHQAIYQRFGDEAYQKDDFEIALAYYQKANLPEKVVEVQQKLWEKQGDEAEQKGELEKALEFYQKADHREKFTKVQKNIWEKLGDDAEQKGELEKALAFYQKANLSEKVTQVQQKLWEKQGNRAEQKGDLGKALELYQKANLPEKIAKVQQKLWEKQGNEAEQKGDLKKALELYQKANLPEKVAEVQQKLWEKQGDEAYQKGELEKALEFYQKANLVKKVANIQEHIQQKKRLEKKLITLFDEITSDTNNEIIAIFVTLTTDNEENTILYRNNKSPINIDNYAQLIESFSNLTRRLSNILNSERTELEEASFRFKYSGISVTHLGEKNKKYLFFVTGEKNLAQMNAIKKQYLSKIKEILVKLKTIDSTYLKKNRNIF